LLECAAVVGQKVELRLHVTRPRDLAFQPFGASDRLCIGHESPVARFSEQRVHERPPGMAYRFQQIRHATGQ
jgi:hypothetical protein